MKLDKATVLRAVSDAVSPYSIYIGHQVDEAHNRFVRNGGKGHPPRRSLILQRLNELANDGMLAKSDGPSGLYGYKWQITEAGRAALSTEGQP